MFNVNISQIFVDEKLKFEEKFQDTYKLMDINQNQKNDSLLIADQMISIKNEKI